MTLRIVSDSNNQPLNRDDLQKFGNDKVTQARKASVVATRLSMHPEFLEPKHSLKRHDLIRWRNYVRAAITAWRTVESPLTELINEIDKASPTPVPEHKMSEHPPTTTQTREDYAVCAPNRTAPTRDEIAHAIFDAERPTNKYAETTRRELRGEYLAPADARLARIQGQPPAAKVQPLPHEQVTTLEELAALPTYLHRNSHRRNTALRTPGSRRVGLAWIFTGGGHKTSKLFDELPAPALYSPNPSRTDQDSSSDIVGNEPEKVQAAVTE